MPDAPLPPLAACFSCGDDNGAYGQCHEDGYWIDCACHARTKRHGTLAAAIAEWNFLRAAVNLIRILGRGKAVEAARERESHA